MSASFAWVAVMRKDLRVLFRDRTALIFIFGLPLIFALVFGLISSAASGRGGKSVPLKVLVVNQDTGAHGAELIQAMKQLGMTEEAETQFAAMSHRVKTGDRPVGVLIPSDFSAKLEAAVKGLGDPKAPQAKLKVLIDPAQSQTAGLAQAAIFGATQKVVGPLYGAAFGTTGEAHPAVQLDVSRQAEKTALSEPSAGDHVMPGLIIYFIFFMANGVAVTLISERQEGTLRRMLSAPIAPGQILFGKLMARSITGVLQVGMLVVIGKSMLGLTLSNDPIGQALVIAACIFAACGLGLLIATMGRTQEQIQGMTTLALLMMGMLSGCLFPRELFPDFIQKLSFITPHAWALTAYQDLLLRNMPLITAVPSILMVLLFGAVFYGFALARFRYE